MTQTETINDSETHNGWKNRATWNISLWISNDENVYNAAHKAVDRLKNRGILDSAVTPSWARSFCRVEFDAAFGKEQTPDGYGVDDPDIDWSEIANMMKDLVL
jgi:hypothetical protein